MRCLSSYSVRKTHLLTIGTALLCSICATVRGFAPSQRRSFLQRSLVESSPSSAQSSPTALNVWWFGGAESSEVNQDGESCELVAVRIDRTSPNSRRIAGTITVPTPLADVWAILTDYDRLAIHVPNLVESKIVSRPSSGEQGDGSYRCKLFQKGAQKIVGFEFGASVTMEMTEKIIGQGSSTGEERMIGFKCMESFFFTEFDGEWKAKERTSESGSLETELTYVVDVRPKGPVPVAALEWRIREDVPTNLRAVKQAATETGLEGVLASRKRASTRRVASTSAAASNTSTRIPTRSNGARRLAPQTNAIRRATIHTPTGSRRSRSGRMVNAPVVATKRAVSAKPRRNVLQTVGRKSRAANQSTKRTPLPFKVKWEADETMAAYLGE